jgi:GTP cyclohydrolase IA
MTKFLDACVPQGKITQEAYANTPRRFAEAFLELMGTNDEEWQFTTFESAVDEMVLLKDIDFVSLCEHHLLPFIGVAHVAYIPQGEIAGLSKLVRTVRTYSRGLWTQEHLTAAIAIEIETRLKPLGVAVVMEAMHTCMAIRGVKVANSKTITSAMRGVFRDTTNTARAEFLSLIK